MTLFDDMPPEMIRVVTLAMAAAVIIPLAILRWRAVRRATDRYQGYRADLLAGTMGLAVVDGDADLNLMLAHYRHTQKSRARTHVTLRGTPSGRPTTFEYDFATAGTRFFNDPVRENRFRCRLTVRAAHPFPAFELTRRTPPRHHEPDRELTLSAVPIDDPALAARFDLRAEDVRVARALGPMLAAMADWEHVHVVGSAGALHWTGNTVTSSTAVYHLPRAQRLLADALPRLEQLGSGRTPPSRTGPPIHPTGSH